VLQRERKSVCVCYRESVCVCGKMGDREKVRASVCVSLVK
jgi:hypothetical protein